MKIKDIKLTSEFKIQTTRAIYAIALFIFVYLLLLLLSLALTILCIIGGFLIITVKISLLTIALGVGIASFGILILLFLLKFIGKSHKIDRSHLHEIKKEDEPLLFAMIDEIVEKVGTDFPKKVYLSNEVNAAVFYDSNFWSMFFPIKKNLQIGMGLINTVTVSELKAILSHEFGHFSQRTMKVGSFVYNVNQVIFNLLEDNSSFDNMIQKGANISGFFALSASLALKIILGIQWVLRKMYEIVNKSYMGLSREMEFHADEIAAHITGYVPLRTSLLRIPFSDHAFNSTLNYYDNKITDNLKSANVYKDQTAVLAFLTEVNQFPLKNELPEVSLVEQSKFNKSKLTIADQWSSHPSTEDRIKRLEKINIQNELNEDLLANTLFQNIEKTQVTMTDKIFEGVKYEGKAQALPTESFIEEYRSDITNNSFPEVYNGYYDNKSPLLKLPEETEEGGKMEKNGSELFSDEKLDLVYTAFALENDIDFLNKIYFGKSPIKTYDYDGKKYKIKESKTLIPELKKELEEIKKQVQENDISIFRHFHDLSKSQGKLSELEMYYSELKDFDNVYDSKFEIFSKLSDDIQFVNYNTPLNEISHNFFMIKPLETKLKNEILEMLSPESIYSSEITPDMKKGLLAYASKELSYFNGTTYNNDELTLLYSALNNYNFLLSRKYFLLKKKLLAFQADLLEKKPVDEI